MVAAPGHARGQLLLDFHGLHLDHLLGLLHLWQVAPGVTHHGPRHHTPSDSAATPRHRSATRACSISAPILPNRPPLCGEQRPVESGLKYTAEQRHHHHCVQHRRRSDTSLAAGLGRRTPRQHVDVAAGRVPCRRRRPPGAACLAPLVPARSDTQGATARCGQWLRPCQRCGSTSPL